MKNNTKKIKQYSMLALAASAVIPMACKEDKTEPDDPEIDVISPNFTTTTAGPYESRDSIFSIGGTNVELFSSVGLYYGDKIAYLDLDGDAKFQKANYVDLNASEWDMLRILPSGSTIDTSNAAWIDPYSNDDGYLFVNDLLPTPVSSGINGQGDKFVAFRTGSASSFKYGWMKVNVSTDGNTLTIKEIALSNVNNKVIKVGAK